MTRNKSKKEKDRNHLMASKCADSFFKSTLPYLERVDREFKDGHLHAGKDLGEMVVAATNITLALELYLKSVRILEGLSVPETHNLWALYKELPVSVKDVIESQFDEKTSGTPKPSYPDLTVTIEINPGLNAVRPNFPSQDGESKDLRGILKRSANAFQTWRYIYETGQPRTSLVFVRFEYAYLRLICLVLKEYAQTKAIKSVHTNQP